MFAFPATKKAKGAGGKAIASFATAGTDNGLGEVRFDHAPSALKAVSMLNGSMMLGSKLTLSLDPNSKDNTKIIVQGIPAGAEWQELKDHFAAIGDVAHAEVKGAKKKGPKLTGEIRYDTAAAAAQAMMTLQGSMMEDSVISIQLDPASKDQTKLVVTGIPAGSGWQELKDHFAQAGMVVAYSGIKGSANDAVVGEVRYDDPLHAQQAMQTLNGSTLGGSQIFVQAAPGSQDGTKLLVQGLSSATQWQELKDHFATIGTVAFAQTATVKKGGMGGMGAMGGMGMLGGKGMGGNMNQMAMMMQLMGMGGMMGGNKGSGGKKGGFQPAMNLKGLKGAFSKGKGKGKGAIYKKCWDYVKGTCMKGANCKWEH